MKFSWRLLLTMIPVCYTLTASAQPLYDIPLKNIDGLTTSLRAYAGKAILIVNVASQCGYTKQYPPLEAIHQKYQEQGFVVLGFPCNDFGGQEPGSLAEIKKFCTAEKYKVTFPLFDKVKVKSGPQQHPLYTALTSKDAPFPGEVKWNFGKFLLGRDGKIAARFESKEEPDSPKVTQAIEKVLAAQP